MVVRADPHQISYLPTKCSLILLLRFACPGIIGQDTVDMRSNVEALRWPLGVPKLDTPPNRALQAVLDELRRHKGAYMFLRVARRYGLSGVLILLLPFRLLCSRCGFCAGSNRGLVCLCELAIVARCHSSI